MQRSESEGFPAVPQRSASALCKLICENGFAARLEGPDLPLARVETLENAAKGDLTFLSNPKYVDAVKSTKASAIVVKDGVELPDGMTAIRCPDPYAAATVAIIAIHGHRRHPVWGAGEGAVVDPSARIGAEPNIAHHVTIDAEVRIGARCTIYPGCYLGPRVRIGDDCTLYPNVVIYDDCVLGDRVTIHAGSVVGQDGLGYAPVGGAWMKIPQVGRVVLGDDVELGANCAIDRATLGETRIGSGTKFSDLVVIGHGTTVGENCMFVAQVGVAGSAKIGDRVTLAGQVGVAGHLAIGDDVSVAAQSGVAADVAPGAKVLGSPALPIEIGRRAVLALPKLPDALKRIKALERQLEDLRNQLAKE